MAQASSADPRSDFWQAFFKRMQQWGFITDARAAFFADCACAQAMFESASWTSNLYLTNCNAIGYKYFSWSDWQSGLGIMSPEGDNYADYASIQNCACELADWIHRRRFDFVDVEDIAGYLDTMSQDGYATVPASQYAHAESFYSVTDPTLYSTVPPNPVASAVSYAETAANTNYGLIVLGVAAAVLLVFLLGVRGLVKKLRM